jgi:hypothetical protein
MTQVLLVTVLFVSSGNNTSHLIILGPNLLFLQQHQLTFALCPKLTKGNPSIVLILVVVAREPIESVTVLIVSSRNNTSHLIFLAPNLLFLQQQ